jgi:beta-lactamase regulating signal transducer with metallopeptidase domain
MIQWLFAFLLHSTLWLGLAWAIARSMPKLRPRLREALWHTALLASLIGPSVQSFSPETVGKLWQFSLPASWIEAIQASTRREGLAAELSPMVLQVPDLGTTSRVPLGSPDVSRLTPSASSLPALHSDRAMAESTGASLALEKSLEKIQQVLLAAWLLGVAFFGCRLAFRTLYFRMQIKDRQPILDPVVRLQLDELRLAAKLPRPIKLSQSQNLGSPVAFGLGRHSEICLPARALPSLPLEQIRAMLGHEVCHHMRRDPWFLQVLNLMQVAFFFQPMLRLARREIHQATEEQCDAWGAQQLEDRWAMAHCLAEVAAWLLPRERRYPVAGMARKRSRLTQRVQRLMECGKEIRSEAPVGRGQKFASALVLVAAPFLGPAVSLAAVDSDSTSDTASGISVPSAENQPLVFEAALPAPELILSPEDQLLFEDLDQAILALESELTSLVQAYGRLVQQDPYKKVFRKAGNRLNQIRQMRFLLARILMTQRQMEITASVNSTPENPNN